MSNVVIPQEDREGLALEAGKVFSPSAPINENDLFSGRTEQIRKVVDAINQRGQHAMIYGERGVGKTSLANILSTRLTYVGGILISPHINCDTEDDYTSVWRKVFGEIEMTSRRRQAGFGGSKKSETVSIVDTLPKKLTTGDVRTALQLIAPTAELVIIIDEFDRITSPVVRSMFADTIKMLSDYSVKATVILVGVADSVTDLIKEHESVERALVQVQMPRMSGEEMRQIIRIGLGKLKMTIQGNAMEQVVRISRGLPHYTHLLGLHASRRAIDAGVRVVDAEHIEGAVEEAMAQTQQSVRTAYHKATSVQRKGSLHEVVLLACGLAATDDLGFFSAADVRAPVRQLTGKSYDIPNYSRHLADFCSIERGQVLQKSGTQHRPRYRFRNPLMQPYVVMKGCAGGRVKIDKLEA